MPAVAPQAHQKPNEDDCSEWTAEAKRNSKMLCVVGAVVNLSIFFSTLLYYNSISANDAGLHNNSARHAGIGFGFVGFACLPSYVSLRVWRNCGFAASLLLTVGGTAVYLLMTSSAACMNATLEDSPYPLCVDVFVKQQIPFRVALQMVVVPPIACLIFRLKPGPLGVLCAAQAAQLLVLILRLPTLTSHELFNQLATCATFVLLFAAIVSMAKEKSTRAARQEKTIQELKARRKGDRIVNHNIKNASGTRALI